jgi:ATP-dependent helicase/nuclease subunit A
MNRPLEIPRLLRETQKRASNPEASAWVSANAGSGKTHVLTQRVLRLLLKGTPPAQILGLTFTKAAAANMANRIFRTLAEWTSLDDEALAAEIVACGADRPSPQELRLARQLFARTIETPGGLKIQTLHAFCERLLKLFPFEANVPAHFKVIDEAEVDALLVDARDRVIAGVAASPDVARALRFVAREAGAFNFEKLLAEAPDFADVFEALGGATDYADALRTRLGLAPGATAASVEAEMLGGDIGKKRREAWARALDLGRTSDKALAKKLRASDGETLAEDRIEALLDAFFTKKKDIVGAGEPRSSLTTLRDRRLDIETDLRCEQDRLNALREPWRAARTLERSEAFFVVAKAILSSFADAKAKRGQLDFADQIRRALALVTRSSAAWVLHKLDYGLDHLLVDEAQDTSAPQWRILVALSAEFFAGESARNTNRTVFAVGDEKQSIFSFQGAAPEKFAEMRRFFEKRHRDVAQPFESVPLNFSFRSSQTILDAVDRTFRSDKAWRGVAATGEPPPEHQAVRGEMRGVVELWPPLAPARTQDPNDWRMPLDEPGRADPAVILAGRIADTIVRWLSPQSAERIVDETTGAQRRIRAGDVMILVRSRGAFFEAMIRGLKKRSVKAAGADRLKLRDHIAVMDLIAAGRAALTPDDDLTLACVLKSPLLCLNEDDLFSIAAERRGSLAAALALSHEECAVKARRRVAIWRKRAKTLSPYAFYARLLGEDGGRRALLGRLGTDATDPIDEFLALALEHERREPASLHRFLAEVETNDTAVKRDMESESEGVRVLTVHASKGLEAAIVFLPDACAAPDGRNDPKLLRLRPAPRALFAWSRKAADDCDAVAAARVERREADAGEHRRLLYVAMTRAAQRLIVAGYETSRGRDEGCWYNLVHRGLADSLVESPAPWNDRETILRFGDGLIAVESAETRGASPFDALPAWLSAKAATEASAPSLRPSRTSFPRDGERERVLEGRLAHALLQALPDIDPARRAAAANAYLDANGGGLAEAPREALAAKVFRVIESPDMAAFFGPGSRGEVSLTGVLRRPGHPDLSYSGRLDRMLVTEAAVSIVDFKLGAAPAEPSSEHVGQLALYRAALQPVYSLLPVRATLVYLDGPTLLPIEDSDLDAALDAVEPPLKR